MTNPEDSPWFYIPMLAIAAVFLVIAFTDSAVADDTWLTINTGSYHINAKKDYNQKNYGVGIEHHIGDFVLTGGIYRNSSYKNSLYAMGGWLPLKFGEVSIGAVAGVANGYPGMNDGGVIFVVAGIVGIEFEQVGANLIILPASDNTPLTLGAQVKFKF